MIATFADTGPGYADRFLALAEGLESILGRRVDLLTSAPLANEILARSVARCRQVVYERARREAVA